MRVRRWVYNLHPAYRGTGGRITYIADDWTELRIRLPLNWRTRNVLGTIFGGSLYASIDPFYVILLMRQLGPDFVVWDKAATIRFRRPGRGTLTATFVMPPAEVEAIRAEVTASGRAERVYTVELVDAGGEVYVTCEKTLSVRPRRGAEE